MVIIIVAKLFLFELGHHVALHEIYKSPPNRILSFYLEFKTL